MVKYLAVVLLLIMPLAAQAEENDGKFQVSANLASLGYGVELMYKPWSFLGFRAVGNLIATTYKSEERNAQYDYDIDFRSAGLVVDVYPFQTGFRISGGARYNLNQINYIASPQDCPPEQTPEECNTSPLVLEGQQLASVRGKVEVEPIAPYIGFGYDGALNPHGNFRFAIDLGMLFQGDPKVKMSPAAGDENPLLEPLVDSTVSFSQQERDIENDLIWMKFYPVIKVSLGYRF